MGKRVFILAGEASGDLHGANLVKAMAAKDPSIVFRGVGSKYMRDAGVRLVWDAAEMAVVGLPGVVHLRTIFSVFRMVSTILRRWRPNLVILIDYPEFNLLIAGKAKKLGIRVMYYISPQIWAWRSGRVRTIRRRVDKMAVILPFEEPFYRKAGVQVSFVGHPLLDVVKVKDREQLPWSKYVRPGRDRLIGLLPGSRQSELEALLPELLDGGKILTEKIPGIHFLMPLAPTITPEQVYPYLRGRDLPLTVVEHNTYDIIQMCEVIVAASGTVTLEAAILGTPLVVIYKVNPFAWWIARQLVRVNHAALANIVAGETVAPELIQHECRSEQIARELLSIVRDDRRRAWMRQRLSEVTQKLGSPGASEKAAAIALELMGAE
ncbi:MAG: lipid-A-disaccharide synthase [Deltaproteobacteria bacterium]|nr:MAG: lipid-A-disaccharide synthase [Deltaproteobacteria bacterium]